MLCLVTGGAGFLGGHLVRLLRASGHRARVLDPAAADPGERGSVTDPAAVARAMQGAELVFHMAAIAHLWSPDAEDFRRINVEGTRIVLEAARRAGPRRLVVTSTALILKGRDGAPRVDESQPVPPLAAMIGAYARSKWLADQACMRAAAEGLPVVRLYPTVPIGPGDRAMTPPTRLIADFLAGRLPAFLDCVLDVIPVEVVALAHLRAAERAAPGARYILAGETIRLSRLLALLSGISGRPMPRFTVPGPLALTAALVSEAAAAITGHPPAAPLAGVRQALRPMLFDGGLARRELDLPAGSTRDALAAAVAWLSHQ